MDHIALPTARLSLLHPTVQYASSQRQPTQSRYLVPRGRPPRPERIPWRQWDGSTPTSSRNSLTGRCASRLASHSAMTTCSSKTPLLRSKHPSSTHCRLSTLHPRPRNPSAPHEQTAQTRGGHVSRRRGMRGGGPVTGDPPHSTPHVLAATAPVWHKAVFAASCERLQALP